MWRCCVQIVISNFYRYPFYTLISLKFGRNLLLFHFIKKGSDRILKTTAVLQN